MLLAAALEREQQAQVTGVKSSGLEADQRQHRLQRLASFLEDLELRKSSAWSGAEKKMELHSVRGASCTRNTASSCRICRCRPLRMTWRCRSCPRSYKVCALFLHLFSRSRGVSQLLGNLIQGSTASL